MSQYLVERIKEVPNILVYTHSEVTAVFGDDHLEKVSYRLNLEEREDTLDAAALFTFIGARPCTDWLRNVIQLDERGFVLAGPQIMVDGKCPEGWPLDRDPFLLETSVPGVFVAGDVRSNSIKRVASAVGEGSIAVQFIHQYLSNLK
jgi:thioredoxin reductase (NADPH)